ncbi:response regulator transcription factor [uncultured Methylophaga sp.]|jgi:DNA-binding NarL/FixJ family response regulator|uniref:response regulator transcription factor n=1 Tax=uncultured Methylophaga sp. TaxID=285271 RepID=UPI002627ECA0|nr:response regulator transcription factor [uncultured Methylophaga sp.]
MREMTMTAATLLVAVPEHQQADAIKRALPDIYAVSAYKDLASLQSVAVEGKPQLILCHQCFFEADNNNLLSELARQCPDSRIMILGPPRPMTIQIAALKQGARGYFNEELPLDKLHTALQLILHGEVWVERHVISGLIDELTQHPEISEQQQQALETLSPKEMEVAKLVSHGATNKMIARQMDITERTVKAHLTTIFQKMQLPDRLSLAIFFRDLR